MYNVFGRELFGRFCGNIFRYAQQLVRFFLPLVFRMAKYEEIINQKSEIKIQH